MVLAIYNPYDQASSIQLESINFAKETHTAVGRSCNQQLFDHCHVMVWVCACATDIVCTGDDASLHGQDTELVLHVVAREESTDITDTAVLKEP